MKLLYSLVFVVASACAVATAAPSPRPCTCPVERCADCGNDCHCLPRAVYGQAPVPFTAKVGGRTAPDGKEIQIDLPGHLHRRNIGSPPPNGPGCCVFTSIHHAALWQNIPVLQEFPQWMVKNKIPGGGYPEKVSKLIAKKCKDAGVPEPDYIQVEGKDFDVLKLACATGRMPCITYSISATGRYNRQRIYHMVNLSHYDGPGGYAAICDNNFPGDDAYEWLSDQEFRRTAAYDGQFWAVIFLSPGPPPSPHN